jgi:hypothetical protein
MVSMKIICGVLLWHGRLVADHASAAHEWMGWALTKCEGDQRRQGFPAFFCMIKKEISKKAFDANTKWETIAASL